MIFFNNHWLLYFLPFSGLPIILHLLSARKRKKIKFTYIHLVKRVVNQYLPKKKIIELLVLILRCLIIFLIIIFFSGPVAYFSPKQRANLEIVILLDNSLSMQQRVGNETKFDICKKSMIELLKHLSVYDILPTIVVFNEKVMLLKERLHLEETIKDLSEINTTYCGTNFSGALEYVTSMLTNNNRSVKKILVFTDLAEHLIKEEIITSTLTNTTTDIIFCYPNIDIKNCYVENLNIEKKDEFIEINYKLKTVKSIKNESLLVKLFIGNTIVDSMDVLDFNVKYSFRRLYDEIFRFNNFGYLLLPNDGLTEDNRFYFSFIEDSYRRGKVLCVINEPLTLHGINSRKFYFEKLKAIGIDIDIKNYNDDFNFANVKLKNYEDYILVGIPELDIISDLQLENSKIVIFPSEKSKLDNYDQFLEGLEFLRWQKETNHLGIILGEDDTWNNYFKKFDYDKIVVTKRCILTIKNKSIWNVILKYTDGAPAVVTNGNLYVFSFDPDKEYCNFVLKPILIGFFDKVLKQDKIQDEKIKNYYYVSEEINFSNPVEKVKRVYGSLLEADNTYYEITYSGIKFFHPGVYEINTAKNRFKIAVNSPIEESNITIADRNKIKKMFVKLGKFNLYFFDINKDKIDKLVQLCMGKALSEITAWIIIILFILETILSRLFKKLL